MSSDTETVDQEKELELKLTHLTNVINKLFSNVGKLNEVSTKLHKLTTQGFCVEPATETMRLQLEQHDQFMKALSNDIDLVIHKATQVASVLTIEDTDVEL
tara:strand:+ start:5914 stop:6216 length:303 start_codon:yes stop_codon:yes gene_type:complete